MGDLEGLKGTDYTIKNRSNKSYKLLSTDLEKLKGTFIEDEVINLTYGYVVEGVAVESVRDEIPVKE